MIRRDFVRTVLAGSAAVGLSSGAAVHANAPAAQTPVRTANGVTWYDCAKMPLEGRAWEDEERILPFHRFPKRLMDQVPSGVRGNSLHSSGIVAHFKTNSTGIWISYENTSSNLGMWHMAPVGVSGFDLYCRDDAGTWRYLNAIQRGPKAAVQIGSGIPDDGKEREFLLYFPLYNGVKHAEIGVGEGKTFSIVPVTKKPILFYGTSILHGACASRPGMPHVSIISRRLNMPFWNFGFSGSGKMEPIMADAFAELDPSIYVIECVPNMSAALVTERAFPFVEKLRAKRPDTPIVLVEDRRAPKAWLDQGSKKHHDANHAALRAQYERMLAAGFKNLTYIEGDLLLPPDGDGTVDNSHQNDYGFVWQANLMVPILQKLL